MQGVGVGVGVVRGMVAVVRWLCTLVLHTYSYIPTPTVIIQLSMKMFALMAFLLIFLAQQ